ncbi:rhodanese-like domain-containing protein [Haloarchaeobius sp. TZWWS8]|uniref:rhodanese-like domain-containing protein n=1 Tax=Haloarchaeobius sp. TZWWS8 TaxID=3446121 RepID=UPI003EBB3B65
MTRASTDERAVSGIWKGYRELVAEAEAVVPVISVEEALERYGSPDTVFVDVRDENERWRDGEIPGALHASRGMLEFHIDPESPYFVPGFGADAEFVFVSGVGSRSLLAAQRAAEMGVGSVASLEGGFREWRVRGGPVREVTPVV